MSKLTASQAGGEAGPSTQAGPSARTGLSAAEAERRLAAEGPNELQRAGTRSLRRIALEVIREPMFGLLLAAGAVYLVLGDLAEAALLLAFASLSVGIAIVQEHRSERVLEALRDLTSPRALVVRDGQRRRIPGREVVRGDLLVLAEGDRVAADALVLECADLLVDESLLTGESVAVRKRPHASSDPGRDPAAFPPGGDDLPAVFAGTLVVRGQGLAEVAQTGAASRIGRIGQALGSIETATPRLTRQTRAIVRTVALVGVACCVAAVLLFGLLRGSWLDGVLAGIALGMSMLPEEFPLVLTVFMVMGAWRLSRARVLTRRAAAIETLGAATVLCTDKTGTLTENRMTIAELWPANGERGRIDAGAPDPASDALLELGVLASAQDPFDPMEKAFLVLRAEWHGGEQVPGTMVRAWPLSPELLAVGQAWRSVEEGALVVAAKGAPEAIAKLCAMDGQQAEALQERVDRMARAGLRVLGVAEARILDAEAATLPDSLAGLPFRFAGLVGLEDPVRQSVPAAVAECRAAGVRVLMITGDYPQTARAIAERAGIDSGAVLTGAEMADLDDDALAAAVARASVFARIMPEQKLRLVQALRRAGEVVAMTGDGVNDAPALKAADIGVAMGGRGTDVAREASSIVLLDDDFGSIVRTVRLGRRIYDNLRKAMTYILAIHVPIAGMALLPLLTGLPIVFWPIHIAFLEMVIDPVCSIVFEAETEESDVMKRPPRDPESRILSGDVLGWALAQGVLAFGVVALVYLGAARAGLPEADVRAVTFVTLVLVNLALILVNRSYRVDPLGLLLRPNRALAWVAVLAGGLIVLAVAWPPAQELFRFGGFHWHDLAIGAGAAIALAIALDLLKFLWGRRLSG
ncbi:cation-translocating P-type ATPase [Burkholderiaceae bacterium FT117]|uniref:cation-translocating P-type ATPase n=1 Tax=Zeimonas sediminis TaxID=2944268 RepID=UPI002342F743|nr:cation-translocating P-type ATPase [Zeimonas sediminis]MCM5569428.1 cation-translocating P-type ATPase [Zeimonas sediminis]